MINMLMGLGIAVLIVLVALVLKISVWVAIPLALVAGAAFFIWQGRKVQEALEKIFARASEQLKRQRFDEAINIMKEGYQFAPKQFLVKSAIDGQIGVVQYLRKKNEEAEPLLKAATMRHYVAKAMLAILQWKRGENKDAKKTFELALQAGKKESLLYGVYAYVLNEMRAKDEAIAVINRGLKICKNDERLLTNRSLLQNNKPMKMKVFGDQWYQFMLERPVIRQEPPPYAKVSKRAMRG